MPTYGGDIGFVMSGKRKNAKLNKPKRTGSIGLWFHLLPPV
jgi:hypothetical protein